MTSCTGRYRRPVATSRPTRRAATYSLTGRPRLGGLTHVPGCERHPTTPNSRKPRLWQRQRRRNRLASEPESSDPGLGRVDYATVASNAATGASLWVAQFNGAGTTFADIAKVVAVSPDGRTVYVTDAAGAAGITTPRWPTTPPPGAALGQPLQRPCERQRIRQRLARRPVYGARCT